MSSGAAAFQQALAAMNSSVATPPAQAGGSSSRGLSIRGQGRTAAARTLGSALRAAGMDAAPVNGMEVDGGRPRGGASARREARNSGGVLDQQSGRHRPGNNAPYARGPPVTRGGRVLPSSSRAGSSHDNHASASSGHLASRISSRPRQPNLNIDPRRAPAGTPEFLRPDERERLEAGRISKAKLKEHIGTDEMKAWLMSKMIGEGVLNLAGVTDDPWLKEQGIFPPGHASAEHAVGTIFFSWINQVIQIEKNITIHTLSLAKNHYKDLTHLSQVPRFLPNLRALDLSENPIREASALDQLLGQNEKKGKLVSAKGSLKSLIELKLNGCFFREKTIQEPNGGEKYQQNILRLFPGLLILDGVNLFRIVFPIQRQPQITRDRATKDALAKAPFTYPVDVQGGFVENELVQGFVMQFCAKFFSLFDTDRSQLLPAYSPKATISVNATSINSSSLIGRKVRKTRHLRPDNAPFSSWDKLPARNLLRKNASTGDMVSSLRTPMDSDNLRTWWSKSVPVTKHPLEDATKWCVDSWILDGEGVNTRLCAMIQGQFEEMPTGTFRSFSRTFILTDAPAGSSAQLAGWPVTIISDSMVVQSYLSSEAYGPERSLFKHGITLAAPSGPIAPPPMVNTGAQVDQGALLAQLRQQTGMNEQFARMCLEQNDWVFERAVLNFEQIKGTIPPEAFQ